MSTKTCYMCEALATSVEHVPPKCLFPVAKDLASEDKSLNFRKQLITVPSCDEHNGDKSTDDEYLFCLLAISILSGSNGQQQAKTKIQRILDSKPKLKDALLANSKIVHVQDNQTKETFQTLALNIERDRIESSLELCARALYFNEFKEKFVGEILVIPLFLSDLDPKFNESVESLYNNTKVLFSGITPKGDNPTIFTYKFNNVDKVCLKMTFYEGANAVAIFNEACK